MSFARRVVLGVLPAAGLLAAGPQAHAAPKSAAATSSSSAPVTPPGEASPAERRAVRGVAIDGADLSETPELREVRRFEQQSFGRPGQTVAPLPEEPARALPPELTGRWGGSGDIPPELRTPGAQARPTASAPAPEAAWLRSLALPELPVRWEPQVVRYLTFFKSDPKGRAIMTNLVRRLGRYQALFERVFERNGLPRDLVYVAMIESGFEPGAVSRVGAGGVWQFMPGVGRAYGLEVSHWVDARRDPERAVEAAARFFKDLHVRFGSWPLAFAAYHAGYGAVLQSIGRFNTNDYWELCRHEAGLPWETTLYVPKILAAAIIGHNLAAFGYAGVAQDPPWVYETVQVAPGTTTATVARAAGTRQDVIDALNPELVRGRTPPDRGNIAVRVPPGSASLYAQAFGPARGASDRVETMVLRFGQSLDDVAKARGISLRELKKLNAIKDTAEVRAGTTIVVPLAAGAVAAAPAPDGAGADDATLVAVPDRTFSYEGRERVFYRTRDGDTLDEIAGVFRVSADDLIEWNHLDPDANLHPRLVLQIFVRKDFDRAGVVLLDPDKVRVVTLGSEEFLELETARRGKTRLGYTARAGDTLAKIARRYGLAPGDLARINRLSSTSDLALGQKVVVYSPTPELPRELTVGRSAPASSRRPPGKREPRATATKAATRSTARTTPRAGAAAPPAGKSGKAAPKSPGKR